MSNNKSAPITPKVSQARDSGDSQKFLWHWIALVLIIIVAIAIRAYINFSSELMPGVNCVYYPVQVRSILEEGKLGFPDFPLTFYLEALVAKIIFLLKFKDLSDSIMFSSKLVDSVLPAFIALPTFLLAKAVTSKKRIPKLTILILPAFTTLSFSAMVMMADMQKNAIGLLWAMSYFYFLYQSIQRGTIKNYLLTGLFFLLTGLTHIGALGLIMAFSGCIAFFLLILRAQNIKSFLLKILLPLAVIIPLVMGISKIFDDERIDRLISITLVPFRLFENPMILAVLKKEVSLQPMEFISAMFANAVAILGIVLIFRKREIIGKKEKAYILSAACVSMLICSPLLGPDWANRLFLMGYIPTALVLVFLYNYILSKIKKIVITIILLLFIIIPMSGMIQKRGEASISKEAYYDLFNVGEVIDNPDKTLIITRHGLEWWVAWVLRTDVAQEFGVDEESFETYDDVFLLKQLSGQGDFGPSGPGGPAFPEVDVPDNAEVIFEDEYFLLAKVDESYLRERMEHWGPEDYEPEQSQAVQDGLMLSHGNCEGEGSVTLSTSPMKPEDFAFIIPYGMMVGNHVTPIDHQYFSPTVFNSPRDTYEVRAMADGRIVEIQARSDSGNYSEDKNEYRIVFMHTCTFFTYYDLVTSLAPDIYEEFKKHNKGGYAGSLSFEVKEGQLIGWIGGQTLDFAVWDMEVVLDGFVVPEHYEGEPWKIHTADPYNYYSDDLKELLIDKNLRTADPIAGKIDYDVDGRLIGNWFEEGTGGYGSGGNFNYWETHLSIVPDHLDPTGTIISFGDYNGEPKQFIASGAYVNPYEVDVETGLVKYDLADIVYVKPNGQMWGRLSLIKNTKVEASEQISGCVLFELISDRKLRMEAFPNREASQVNGFTSGVKVYER